MCGQARVGRSHFPSGRLYFSTDMETIKLPEPVIVEPVVATPADTTTNTRSVAAPKTTAEEDRKTQGQRNINLIWEATQAVIAVIVTLATIYSAIRGVESLLLGNAFTLIIALYFVRQNHTKVGGIGGTDTR